MLSKASRGALVLACIAISSVQAQQAAGKITPLTAQDYIDIQQLVSRYGFVIDSCSNNGYDYADLYTPDGEFSNSLGRTVWKGREKLAEAAGGGTRNCKKLTDGSENGRGHTTANLVIEASPEGATGKCYLVYHGERGVHSDPLHDGHVGGYQDVYVKTPQGWRIKSRIHIFPPDIPGMYKPPADRSGSATRPAPTPTPSR